MRAVFLDLDTVTAGDLDLAPLYAALPDLECHALTTAAELPARLAGAEAVITNKVPLGRAALEAAPALRLVCVAATGTDHIDLEAARARGIVVCNVRGYATASVVQHVFALILALTTRLPAQQRRIAAGAWSRSPHFTLLGEPVHELHGRRLGIVGHGELGRAVAAAAPAFGLVPWIAERRGRAPRPGRRPFEEVLAGADVLSLHCPLTAETHGLIDAAALERMRPGALLINTARGGLIDEPALAAALRAGRLGGAGLDVLGREPPPSDHPLLAPDLAACNLIVTPHVAWAAHEARARLIAEIAANARAFLAGAPRNRVA